MKYPEGWSEIWQEIDDKTKITIWLTMEKALLEFLVELGYDFEDISAAKAEVVKTNESNAVTWCYDGQPIMKSVLCLVDEGRVTVEILASDVVVQASASHIPH